MSQAYEQVIEALEQRGLLVPGWGEGKRAHCPGPNHSRGDERPSLSVAEADNRVLLYCHTGCDIREVVDALGLKMRELFDNEKQPIVATYTYTDEGGLPLYRKHRVSPKNFWFERFEKLTGEWVAGLGSTRRVLYRLPEILNAVAIGEEVWIVEGEKDVENLRDLGICATSVPNGSTGWRAEYASALRGANVVILADDDEAGRRGAEKIRAALGSVASELQCYLPKRPFPDASAQIYGDSGSFGKAELRPLISPALDELEPFDWEEYEAEEVEWLFEPYVPANRRVLAFGPAGSLKSLWAMWLGSKLAAAGKKIAYFSLEMTKSDDARRLSQLKPPKQNFKVLKNISFNNPIHTRLVIENLKHLLGGDPDLIIVDSWSAAHQGASNNNDEVARLDNEVFQPILESTGATVLVLDNTGHAFITESGKIKPDYARGASAKEDKVDVSILFDRPYADDGYLATLAVKKWRMPGARPGQVMVKTLSPPKIEFYHTDATGQMNMDKPLWVESPTDPPLQWSGSLAAVDEGSIGLEPAVGDSTPGSKTDDFPISEVSPKDMSPYERRALARVKDAFKVVEEE